MENGLEYALLNCKPRKKRSLGRPAFESQNPKETVTKTQIGPKKNSVTATSTTEVKKTPEGTTITKTVVEPSVKPYSSSDTPFGEIRQPTGLESMFGIDPAKMTALNKQKALGQNENGVFETKNFDSAHPDFNVSDYLRKAIEAKDKGYYGLEEEGLLDWWSKFRDSPQDEAERTNKAYANNAFDKTVQNLIDDIVIYKAFHNQLSEANLNNDMPKVRADVARGFRENDLDKKTFNSLMFNDEIDRFNGYKPGLIDRGENSVYQYVKNSLKDDIAKRRPAIEKDIYRKLAEINKNSIKQEFN